jgi:plasmid stability protein
MEDDMKNITLSIDDALLDQARIYAAKRGTSVNALVREYLVQVANSDERIQRARAEIRKMSGRDGLAVGDRSWSRDDLHGR